MKTSNLCNDYVYMPLVQVQQILCLSKRRPTCARLMVLFSMNRRFCHYHILILSGLLSSATLALFFFLLLPRSIFLQTQSSASLMLSIKCLVSRSFFLSSASLTCISSFGQTFSCSYSLLSLALVGPSQPTAAHCQTTSLTFHSLIPADWWL